jgi:hypothetical protein
MWPFKTKENKIKEDEFKKVTRQIAMSEFILKVETLKGEKHTYKWQNLPLRYLHTTQRPHSQAGLQYMVDGEHVFIPWAQIKISSFKEILLWDDGWG